MHFTGTNLSQSHGIDMLLAMCALMVTSDLPVALTHARAPVDRDQKRQGRCGSVENAIDNLVLRESLPANVSIQPEPQPQQAVIRQVRAVFGQGINGPCARRSLHMASLFLSDLLTYVNAQVVICPLPWDFHMGPTLGNQPFVKTTAKVVNQQIHRSKSISTTDEPGVGPKLAPKSETDGSIDR